MIPWTIYIVHGILQARILGVGSLSLLQEIFPTQKSNRGLLHCRQILYQLIYQGSPLFNLCEALNLIYLIYVKLNNNKT